MIYNRSIKRGKQKMKNAESYNIVYTHTSISNEQTLEAFFAPQNKKIKLAK